MNSITRYQIYEAILCRPSLIIWKNVEIIKTYLFSRYFNGSNSKQFFPFDKYLKNPLQVNNSDFETKNKTIEISNISKKWI